MISCYVFDKKINYNFYKKFVINNSYDENSVQYNINDMLY